MKKSILLTLFAIFYSLFTITGCTPPSAMTFFDKDELYTKAIQYTKKADIITSFETKAICNVTYLNRVDKQWDNDEQNFIVGIYIVEDEKDDDKKYLNNPNVSLTMNGRNSISVTDLNSSHEMFGRIPLYNHWAKYYVVKFDKKEKETKLNIKFSHKTFGSANLMFRSK